MKVPVEFALPDNVGSRAKGLAYYQNITLYLPSDTAHALRGFEIRLASPTIINIGEMRVAPYGQWDKEMALLLGSVNVVSIDKFQ